MFFQILLLQGILLKDVVMVAPPSLFDNFKSYFSAELNKQISTKGNIDPDFQNSDSDSDWLINNYANFFKSDVNQKGTQASINKISEIQKYGTTRHIKEIFFGRCYEYQYKNGVLEENEWNCENLWKLFFKAFGFKKPCDVTSADYKELLDNIDERIPRDKALLWSGTRELAHKYSDFLYTKRFTTLEDTLAGYLLNGLTWCGSDQPPGINFNQCPWECSIQAPYWSLANQRFAQKLSGIIHIVLNGTRQHYTDKKLYPAYMKHRYYLGPYMIPEFNKRNISMVVIIVAHTLHLKPIESCGQKTVQMLADDIKAKDIPVVCYDDPSVVKHILCVDDPMSLECMQISHGARL